MHQLVEYSIRKATSADAQEIAKTHFDAVQKSYSTFVNKPYLDALSLDKFILSKQKMLNKEKETHFVVVFNKKIVGFCDVGPLNIQGKNRFREENEWENFKNCGELYSIYINNEHQRNGVGRALFKCAQNELFKQKLTPFLVWSIKENFAACSFYEKLGGELVVNNGIINFAGKVYVGLAYLFKGK